MEQISLALEPARRVFTVRELNSAVRALLEADFQDIWVAGEISGTRLAASGHYYFTLKEQDSVLRCACFRNNARYLKFKPQDGVAVLARGRLDVYEARGEYQLLVEYLEPQGYGALQLAFEQLKKKLAAEGLFDAARKRALPRLPRRIGVVTSPTGAVIRDILHRLADRFPRPVLVWPVRVQGEGAAEEIAAAIRGFNALEPGGAVPRPDVLIVARGGGSIEDLWCFNEEIVVRAAAESAIPLISAVGHETDVTLIDHAADRRAPTPTGAAEMAVPVLHELLADLDSLSRRHAGALLRLVEQRRAELRGLTRALPGPEGLLAQKRQRLDLAEARLAPALAANARDAQARLNRALQGLARNPPSLRLARARERLAAIDHRPRHALERVLAVQGERLSGLSRRLGQAPGHGLERLSGRLSRATALFSSLNYRAVLARGYALVLDGAGRPVGSADGARAAGRVALEFADGRVSAVVEGAGAPETPPEPARPAPRRAARRKDAAADTKKAPAAGAVQGSLFET
jgi:exodeoxyribonuclease VII large subunit